MTNVPWAERAAAAQAANRELLPKEYLLSKLPGKHERNVQYFAAQCGLLSAKELEITESPEITGLLAKLADGTYSTVEVTTAFIKRAVIAQQVCNPLAETLFDQALVRAQELDDHLAKTGKTVGPLHGLPISLKDQIDVKGVNHTMSYVARIGEKADKDAVITEILLKQGAVLYCKTIMSQGLWFGEGYNNVHGRVLNPYNRDLTSGGSSGGEGALVGFRGSLLGVGSDIGGSVRIPAAFSGVYGLRGSYGRIPYANASNSGEGQESVRSILGPITTSIDGLKTFYKAVLDAKPWDLDPWTPRMPWSEEAYQLRDHGGKGAKLCFAIMWDDGVVKPMPPYKRALEMTKKALLAAGHEVVDWVPYKAEEAIALLGRTFVADGSKEIKDQTALSGEPILTQVLDLTLPELSTSEYFALCHRRTAFIKEALDHWNATVSQTSTGRPVDAIILPASAHAPIKHDDGMYIGYTGYGNLTDWTASVFPVTQVQPEVDVVEGAWAFRNKYDESVHKSYEPEVYRDAPISLQCMGRKYEEEAVIKMTEIIAEALAA